MATRSGRILNILLICGILLRFAVLVAASPFDADSHLEVIQYIADHGTIPFSNQFAQSFHPPLYYLLMAPLNRWWPDPAAVHVASFLFSIANIILIRYALGRFPDFGTASVQAVGFALICFAPQVVMFGSFISNDTLAMLMGTSVFVAALRYIERPSWRTRWLLAVWIGLGLLTKGTFILVGPAMAFLVTRIEKQQRRERTNAVVAMFCLIWISIGCYKYVDNLVRVGDPFVNNLDVDSRFKREQSGTWKGLQTLYDVNVVKLIRRPVLQNQDVFSYPLLMYGTFWYSHIPNESSFHGNIRGYQWVGSLIYAVAIVPTALFLIGLVFALVSAIEIFCGSAPPVQASHSLALCAALAIVLANVTVVIAAGVRYDVWSCFQSRLCFPSLAPALLVFCLGMEKLARFNRLGRIAHACCWATVAVALLYFCIEIPLANGWLSAPPVVSQ